MGLTRDDFEYIRGLIHRQAAITLDDGKEYLAETRLHVLAQREGIKSVGELMTKLRVDPRHCLQYKVVEAMTTNETSFFRDIRPFEAIRKSLIPDLLMRRGGVATAAVLVRRQLERPGTVQSGNADSRTLPRAKYLER